MVEGLLGKRTRKVVEYQVKWAGDRRGKDKVAWLPRTLIHAHLVTEYEQKACEAADELAPDLVTADSPASSPYSTTLPDTAAATLIAQNYRRVLQFLEPPAWAQTSHRLAAVESDEDLADFPLVRSSKNKDKIEKRSTKR